MFQSFVATEAGNPENQDRAAIVERPDGLLLILADGAGGLGGGAEAAELAIEALRQATLTQEQFLEPQRWRQILAEADQMLATHPTAGEAAAVVAALTRDAVCGASVGDSGAILFQESGEIELTAHQQRKPLLGSGAAFPVPFGPAPSVGTLLVASDGLLRYASHDALRKIACATVLDDPATALIECVRYPSGALPDDVTAIVCRATAAPPAGSEAYGRPEQDGERPAIREATKEDVALLTSLIRGAFRGVAERLGVTAEQWPHFSAFTTGERVAAEMDEETTYYILESGGQPRGCVGLKEREPGVCHFRRLAVLPESRGRGFGAALVSRVVAEARGRGAHRLELGIVAQETGLAEWYGKLGFSFKETRHFEGMPFAVTFMFRDL